jgi:hypothetical protein
VQPVQQTEETSNDNFPVALVVGGTLMFLGAITVGWLMGRRVGQ